ncbi:cytochrome c oxidase subunit VB-domain-containing protein [Rhodotorula diobovata]|uniref:Cytochrome c oxidase subunit VB-domain-containing protein n=1 Tax=Rhodotorula diobovata TaxID=5288 RepID=A0A5C5FNW9_9BASI|nr:cytochrome c oxidase subunit VB-domain-containing protein [Rhodotorula diobovata]
MLFRSALRSVVPRALPRVQAPAARTFASALPRLSAQEPVIQGPGGKAGEVPTDLEQATGLERFELLHKLKGEEAFSLEPLEVPRLGTVADPIMVFSLDTERIVGCTGFPVDSHDTILFPVGKDKPVRCPECGCAYQTDFQGVEHDHGHH